MSWVEQKTINEKRSVNAQNMKALLAQGPLDAERSAQFDKLHAEEQALAKQYDAIEVANKAERSVNEMIGRDSDGFKLETSKDAINNAKRKALFGRSLTPDEQRTLLSAGGAFVPDTLSAEFIRVAQTVRGVIAAGAKHHLSQVGGVYEIPKLNDASNTGEMLAAENSQFADQDYSESQISLPVYKFTSKAMRLSKNYVRDSQLNNLEAELAFMGSTRIFKRFNYYATVGSGSGQPEGVVTGASAGKTFASPTAVTYLEVLDLIHSLGEHYRPNAKLMCADSTLLALRKIVSSDGVPLWGPGNIAAGVPETFGGVPYIVNSDMAAIGASAVSMLYGDFTQGYAWRSVGLEPEVTVLPVSDRLQLGWIFDLDLGGVVTDSTAIKKGTHPAS